MTKDWEPQQEEIQRLYVAEGKPLAEVMRIIEGKNGFIASKRAYRDQLRKWGYMKYRTQAFPKPKKRARISTRSGQRPVSPLPDPEVLRMLQRRPSLLDASHNMRFATAQLSSAGVPESQYNDLDQDTQVPGFLQLDQNAQDSQGKTHLHRAALDKDIEQVRSLLNAGAAVDIHDHAGNTPLHSGVVAESIEIVLLILRFRPNVDAKNLQGRAPLHLAISQPGIVNALVDNGADVSIQDEKGDTPLHLVLSTDSSEESSTIYTTVDILLKSGADPNKENNAEVTPFLKLLDRPYHQEKVLLAICSFLEKDGSTQRTLPDGRTPLQIFLSRSAHYGLYRSDSKNELENTILRHFIAKGASVVTPILHTEPPMPLILKYCEHRKYAWNSAYARLGREIFERITTEEVKKVGNSLLLVLVGVNAWQRVEGVGKLVRILLHRGANPNHANLLGETPLIVLFEESRPHRRMAEILLPLLEYGADPWQRDHSGTCALFRTAENQPEQKFSRMILQEDLRRRRNPHTSKTELRDPNKSETWVEWQEAALAADWSESKAWMLREPEADSNKASKALRDCALGVLAEHHIRLAKDKFQGQVGEMELRRKYVAGILRDCRECKITLDGSCTDYLIELCLE